MATSKTTKSNLRVVATREEGIALVRELYAPVVLPESDAANLYLCFAGVLCSQGQPIIDSIQERLYYVVGTGDTTKLPTIKQIRSLSAKVSTGPTGAFRGMAFSEPITDGSDDEFGPTQDMVGFCTRHADWLGRDEEGNVKMPKTRGGYYRLIFKHRETFGQGTNSSCMACNTHWAERQVQRIEDQAKFQAGVAAGKAQIVLAAG